MVKNVKHALTSEVMPKSYLKLWTWYCCFRCRTYRGLSVYLSVCVLCKNDRNDRDAVWGLTFGHKEPYIILRPDALWKEQFWG